MWNIVQHKFGICELQKYLIFRSFAHNTLKNGNQNFPFFRPKGATNEHIFNNISISFGVEYNFLNCNDTCGAKTNKHNTKLVCCFHIFANSRFCVVFAFWRWT